MTIWSRLTERHWIGVTDKGHYHVLHLAANEKQNYAVVFIPIDPTRPPNELGKRSTLANAKYCAEMHDRLANVASYSDTVLDI